MSSSRDEKYLKEIRGRQQYSDFLDSVNSKRAKLEDPQAPNGPELLNDYFSQLDQLFDQNVSGKSNTSLIHVDQSTFRDMAEIITERLRNQARGIQGEITVETFLGAVAGFRPELSRDDALCKLGQWFSRASNVVTLPAFMPTLNEVHRNIRAPSSNTGRRSRPTQPPEEAGSVDGTEFQTHEVQEKLQGIILDAVSYYEESHEFEPVLLHQLCFDNKSFTNTLENIFLTGALLRTQLLWLGAKEGGLPVVGTVQNRKAYLQKHTRTERSEPTAYSGPDFRTEFPLKAEQTTGRKQFNLNLTYELYEELQNLFGQEETLVDREQLNSDSEEENAAENA